MTQQEKEFIQANIINFESVKLGFTRNLTHEVMAEYERIYRKYLDPHFALTYYCSACVFDMLHRLIYYYDSLPIQEAVFTFPDDLATIQPEAGAVSELPKKRGRKQRV